MNFKKPQILLVSFAFIFSISTFAQQPGQSSGGFKLFFEKVYLHLDRTYYAPGDDIWFKAYLVNAQNNLPFNTSNNLYVELIDPSASIVSRKVIRMDTVGVGDFHLQDSIPSGAYRIRAYTNWMRNFGDYFVFEKEIFVTDIPGVTKTTMQKKSNNRSNKNADAGYKIQFLPEGGNLVESVPTIVAFKAEDANGKGVDASGFILSSQGDTAVKFKTTHLGMGSFSFTPRAGFIYKTFVQYRNGEFVEAALPPVSLTGFVMNVTNGDSVVVSINSNTATTKIFPTGIMNLAARHAGKSYFKQQVLLKEGKATVSFSANDFPTGIASITLYDEDMHPHCERLIYIDKEEPLHVQLTTDKTVYGSREKITVNLSVTDAQNKPVKTNLSLAAVEDGAGPVKSGDIFSYLLLESELQGKIENPSAYFDKKNSDRLQQLDLLLATQGWRSFLWRRIVDTTLRISYLPEAGITISGTVTKPFSKKTMSNMHITLFAPDARGDKIYVTQTNASGKYYLDGLPIYGMQSIKLDVGDGIGKNVGELYMDTLFANPLPVVANPVYRIDSAGFNSFANEAARRWSLFKNSQMLPNVTVTAKKRGVTLLDDGSVAVNFGYPEYDFNINNNDYKYPRLRDFLVQKVPGAMYDDEMEGVYFLSNGKKVRPVLRVNNKQDIFGRLDYYSLSMQQIENVHVKHMVGTPTYNRGGGTGEFGDETNAENTEVRAGIRDYFVVSLNVKPGDANQQLSKINVTIPGYYEARMFYAPNYSSETLSEPDERTTIHWEPLISTDENGKATVSFYNADPKTKIRVNVQGLTNNGIPVVANTVYEVK